MGHKPGGKAGKTGGASKRQPKVHESHRARKGKPCPTCHRRMPRGEGQLCHVCDGNPDRIMAGMVGI